MSYKITEEGNVATVHLDGEIDMDVTEKAKEQIMPLIEACLLYTSPSPRDDR
mgnify:CR=1 FL=1